MKTAVMIVAVIVTGVLAGLYIGTGLAQVSNLGAAYQVWVPRQQGEVGLFKNFMPALGYTAILLPAVAAMVSSGARRWFFVAAAGLIVCTIVTTEMGEIPLNALVLTWDPHTPVAGWDATRASWLHFHWTKTTLSLLAFAAAATGLSRR